MDSTDFDLGNPASGTMFELATRNRLASRRIEEYTAKHRRQDGLLSVGGFLPVPGAGFVAMLAAVGLQAPRIYKPMAVDIGNIYLATPEELHEIEKGIVAPGLLLNAFVDIASEITTELMQMIIGDIVGELVLGSIAASIPVVGGFVGLALDLYIATKMTRRVGLMVSIFYQNQARWIEGGREATYRAAKDMKGDAGDVRREISEVWAGFVKRAKAFARDLMKMPGATIEQVREILMERNVPPDIIEEALRGM